MVNLMNGLNFVYTYVGIQLSSAFHDCLSYVGTIKQMRQLATDFDEEVVMWSNSLKENIHVSNTTRISLM